MRIDLLILLGLASLIGFPTPALSQPHTDKIIELHLHPHLTLIMNGREITLPADIGIQNRLWNRSDIDRYSDFPLHRAPVHTHDQSGELHVESTIFKRFTLADFLNVWGVDQTVIKNIFLNGQVVTDKNYPLRAGQDWKLEIEIDISPKNFTSYQHPVTNLTFHYPSSWTISDLTPDHSDPVIREGEKIVSRIEVTPPESSYLNTPHLYIEEYELPNNYNTLDQFTTKFLPVILNATERRIPSDIPFNGSNQIYNLNGYPARQFELNRSNIYVNPSTLDQYSEKFQKYRYIWAIHNDKMLIVLYRAYPYAYKQYESNIENILSSIKWS
jgi:hypothetical protein